MRIQAGLFPVLGRSLIWNCRVLGSWGKNGDKWVSEDCQVFVFICRVSLRRPTGQAQSEGNKGFHKLQLKPVTFVLLLG